MPTASPSGSFPPLQRTGGMPLALDPRSFLVASHIVVMGPFIGDSARFFPLLQLFTG
jgi:hypothetical protein